MADLGKNKLGLTANKPTPQTTGTSLILGNNEILITGLLKDELFPGKQCLIVCNNFML